MALKEHGIEKFGRLIDQNIAQGHYLSTLIEAEPLLELVAPPSINIVCFRYRGDETSGERQKALNTEIMLRLQEEGIAALSDTTVHGQHCLRVAINNHRTRREDLDLLVRETVRLGREISRSGVALPSPLVGEGKTRDHASSQTFSKCCSSDWCCSQPCTPLR